MKRVRVMVLGALCLSATASLCAGSTEDLDFWIGEWNLTWESKEGIRTGENRIEPNRLVWSWESSKDAGETWTPIWVIQYERKE